MRFTDKQAVEIYNKLIEKKRKFDTPYSLGIKSYGLQDWTSLKERVKKILDKEKHQAVFLSKKGVYIINEMGIKKISCPIKERVEKIRKAH